jgi:hypothetical protein
MNRTALCFLLPVLGALPAISQTIPGYAIPNSKHYRESGVGNATGRSGSANLTARALLGEDGNTMIELTTGVLDSNTPPPGSFAKIQFKPLSPDGDPLFAQNFNGLATSTGYYTFNSPSLFRNQQIQLQGNIRGIDNRTDVASVIETVKLRPDLAVASLGLPDSTIVSTPTTITANVAEVNGDASATTTCQLTVDGIGVDQAKNVYVDAAGSVTCMFTYTFTSTGTHNVQVSAIDVVPSDWDTANNSVSGTINVVNLTGELAEHGSVKFLDQSGDLTAMVTTTSQTSQGGYLGYSYTNTSGKAGESQSAQSKFYSGGCAGATNAVPYQFPVSVIYTETMDGTQAFSGTYTGLSSSTPPTPVSTVMCGTPAASYLQRIASNFSGGVNVRVLTQAYYDSSSTLLWAYQDVEATRSAGDVTYFSTGIQCGLLQWTDCNNPPTNYYAVNNSGTPTVTGTMVTPGQLWTPSITAVDNGGNAFGGSLGTTLTSTPFSSSTPNKCNTSGPDSAGYTYQNCSSSTNNYTITKGSNAF